MRGLGVLAACLLFGTVTAQPPLIAILQSGEGSFYADAVQRFHQTLEQQGIAAQTLAFSLKGDRTDKDLPRRVLERKPSLIFAVGTDAARLIKDHYANLPPSQRVPVVFALVIDPIEQGLIQSVERSGTRFAGVALTLRPQRQFQALRDVAAQASRVGVIYNPSDRASQRLLAWAREDAGRVGLSLVEAHAAEPKQLSNALQTLEGKVDALWLVPDPVCAGAEPFQQILRWAQAQRIPIVAFAERFVRDGALMGVGVDFAEQGALAAEQAIQILQGEEPETLPLLAPRRVLIYYNLQTARTLGVAIHETLLNLARKVYDP